MNGVIIQDIIDKKIEVIFLNEKISLPLNIQEQIDDYKKKIKQKMLENGIEEEELEQRRKEGL